MDRHIIRELFFLSFVFGFVSIMTLTLIAMFFSPGGIVRVHEPIIAIRILEIGIGLFIIAEIMIRIGHIIKNHQQYSHTQDQEQ